MLGPVAAGPAVADDEREPAPAALVDLLLPGGRPGHLGQGEQEEGGGHQQGRGASGDRAHGASRRASAAWHLTVVPRYARFGKAA